MRIWHEQLIPYLCQKHLCGCWREGLGMMSILLEDKKAHRNYPATKEFEYSINYLWVRLNKVRNEMLRRGYHPKELPNPQYYKIVYSNLPPKEWQTLEEQLEVLKSKKCKCYENYKKTNSN